MYIHLKTVHKLKGNVEGTKMHFIYLPNYLGFLRQSLTI